MHSEHSTPHAVTSVYKNLKESEIFYKHLAELAIEAVVVHSEGKIVYMNPTAKRLMEAKSAREVIGKPVWQFIHPDSVPLIKQRIQKMLSKHKVAPFVEERFITTKGKVVTAETKAVPFIFNGKPAILAILHDVTQRKKSEERQKYLNEIGTLLTKSIDYETTLNTICKILVPSLADYIRIVIKDERNHLQEIAEYHVDSQKRHFVKELYASYKSMPNIASGVEHILATGKAELLRRVTPAIVEKFPELKKVITKLGLVSYMGVPLKIRGKVMGVITFSSTKKERIYSPDDVRFAQEVAIRISYAIDNAMSYLKAKQYIDQQDAFISMASHELRTPLTVTKMYGQLLQRELTNNAKALLYLEKIKDQSEKLTSLVITMLDTTRIQQGKLVLEQKPFHFCESLFDVVAELEVTIGRKLTVLCDAKGRVYGSKERIAQVVTNLIINAAKFSSKHTKIVIRSQEKEGFIVVSVQDFGRGIPKTELQYIFNRFYQVQQNKTFPGLGLGLYIASEIIKQHGGKMWVKSEVEKGSTFYFSLPLYKNSHKGNELS